MQDRIRQAVKRAFRNWKALIGFEIIFKLMTAGLLVPAAYGLFALVMRLTGYSYLTAENILHFFRHPLTWLFPIAMILIVSLYSLFDISAVIYVMDESHNGRRTYVPETFVYAFQNMKKILKTRKLRVLVLLFLMVVVFNISLIPGLLGSMSTPGFLLRRILRPWYAKVTAVFFALLFMMLLVRRIYVFHYIILRDNTLSEAVQSSRRLEKKYWKKDLIIFFIIQGICYLLYVGALALGIFLVVWTGRLIPWKLVNTISTSVLTSVLTVVVILMTVLGTPIGYVSISVLFYDHGEREGEIPVPPEAGGKMPAVRHSGRRIAMEAGLFAASFLMCAIYVRAVYRGYFNPNIEYVHTMEVTAHRGASRYYPENTMAAFQGAVEQGADWIELDVQQSRDGQIFVMHDLNFKRTTGVDKNAWELDYDEIRKLDAGSFFSKKYAGEKIPLLEDVIAFAKKSGVRLNIELKPSGHEKNMEQEIVDLIQKEKYADRCVVTSQSYNAIRKVKEYDEDITTVYVMGFAYGNLNRLKMADYFSVRASSISEYMVSRLHNSGRQIYAWTVNSRYSINEMIDRGVDNIITDDVPMAKECIGENHTTGLLNEYIKLLQRLT